MNFKIKPFALFLAGAALAMTGCKDDVMGDVENGTQYEGSYVHVKAGISLPSTRSATEDDPTGEDQDMTNSNEDKNGYDDFEIGTQAENEIRTMILVYTDDNNNYITHSTLTGLTKAPTSGQRYDYEVTAEIQHENLQKAYENGGILYGKTKDQDGLIDVRVYAICNYTDRLASLFNGNVPHTNEWMDWPGDVEEDPSAPGQSPTVHHTIWAQRSFLMTNAAIANVKFPGEIEEWDEFADASTPWKLNLDGDQKETAELKAIPVERAAARLDFRDGSEDGDNTYHLVTDDESYVDGKLNLIDIQLTRMSLVNMSKNFYYLRRVSEDGTDNNVKYCGIETSTNYVVDTDFAKKLLKGQEGGITTANAEEYFNFPLYTTDGKYNKGAWYTDNITDVLNNGNDDTWNGPNSYKVWRYVTENTIPYPDDNQITVQSTGIVFKGQIKLGKDAEDETPGWNKYISEDLKEALTNPSATSAILYCFENRLFAGPKDIIMGAAQDGENSALYGAVSKVLENWKLNDDGTKYVYDKDGSATGIALTPKVAFDIIKGNTQNVTIDDADLTDANFMASNTPKETKIAVYEPELNDDDTTYGYYCYYFYWNRHNDNSKSGLMGPMEFATVRNNVYKLSVTKIGKLGHPTTPDDDPDPEEPGDPDEDPTNYIQVNVEVLPWVVRVNNIEF